MVKLTTWTALALSWVLAVPGVTQAIHRSDEVTSSATPEPILVDTDIGDDIDDALAIALLLRSPEVKVVGITTAWGDTASRGRLVDRLLRETGHTEIPVGIGVERHRHNEAKFSQLRWATAEPQGVHVSAVYEILRQTKEHPNQLTLLAIGPLTNVAAALVTDAETFHKLRRIIVMCGSIRRGYNDLGYGPDHGPDLEYNVAMDVAAAQQIFASGVPIYMIPVDSSQHKLDEVKRALLFSSGSPLTNALALLYFQWSPATRQTTPTMYDAVAAAFAVDSRICPMAPLHIQITNEGWTQETPGTANTNVCLVSSQDQFFAMLSTGMENCRRVLRLPSVISSA